MSDFSRRQVLAIAGAGLAGAALPQITLAAGTATATAATAITEVFGDGLRLTGGSPMWSRRVRLIRRRQHLRGGSCW